jgi:hypothetical protein
VWSGLGTTRYSAAVNPKTIRWQACVSFALFVLLGIATTPKAALFIAGPAGLWWLVLNVRYAYALGDRGRTERRLHGDKWVARYVAFGLVLPLAIMLVLLFAGYGRDPQALGFTTAEASALLISLAALFALILCSSLIDWYYIRPRIDGVVCTPPCRSSGSERWKGPTRVWFLHRGVATLAYIGFALVVALVVMLMLVREHPAAAGVIGGVGGLASLLLIFAGNYRAQIPSVARFVLSPAYCLGDDLTYEVGKWGGRGFVLHVAVPVTKLVPLRDDGMPTGVPFAERKNSELNEADLISRECRACDGGCVKLNPQCTVPFPRTDQRRRLLIF